MSGRPIRCRPWAYSVIHGRDLILDPAARSYREAGDYIAAQCRARLHLVTPPASPFTASWDTDEEGRIVPQPDLTFD